MKIKNKNRDVISSHGVKLLLPGSKKMGGLRKQPKPVDHGHKVWPTTWMLIDYLKETGAAKNKRVLELACGWGLPGIFCSKVLNSKVTWIDGDEKVYPFYKILAEENGVEENFIHMDLNKVGRRILENIDIVIASDMCFCDTLIDPIRRFINRAKDAGVSQIYISDPGRWPFEDLTELLIKKKGVELIDWKTDYPVKTAGKILCLR